MINNNKENKKVEKHARGWNLRALKGKKKDKDSPGFKRWFERHRASRAKTTRRRLEKLAKAPLQERQLKIYKTKSDQKENE